MNPCAERDAYALKPFTPDTKLQLGREYLVYNALNDEWNIAQWDGTVWESTISDGLYPVTHYQELPPR